MSDIPDTPPTPVACPWCGGIHAYRCPIIKALEFDPQGRVTRVEFLTPADLVQNADSIGVFPSQYRA